MKRPTVIWTPTDYELIQALCDAAEAEQAGLAAVIDIHTKERLA